MKLKDRKLQVFTEGGLRLDTANSPFSELDINAGDAYSLLFRISHIDNMDLSAPERALRSMFSNVIRVAQEVEAKNWPKAPDFSKAEKSVSIIPADRIREEVMEAVSQAEREINMSMLLSEEVEEGKDRLPDSYHKLLADKLSEGVVIHRLGFGSRQDFKQINERLRWEYDNFVFSHIPNASWYQRFIMIDKKKLFFFADSSYVKTENKQIIEVLDTYIRDFS
jgi:hypothetical protein